MNVSNNCSSPYDRPEYIGVAVASVVSAFASFIASCFVISLILLLKKYKVLVQRLILYLSIATLINGISQMFHRVPINYITTDPDPMGKDGFCVFAGFFEQNAGWMQLNAMVCITVHLFLCAVINVRLEKLELAYFLIIFILPFSFNWIPFIELAYGKAGAWCWIRDTNEDCSSFVLGEVLRFVLWYVPLYLILLVLIILYCFILYKLYRTKRHWVGRYDPTTERLKEQTRTEVTPLVWYPFIYIVLNFFPLINRIHNFASRDQPNLALWYLHAISYPLVGAFVAVPFVLDPETRRALRWSNFKATLSELCQKSPEVQEYPLSQEINEKQNNKISSTIGDSTSSSNYNSFKDK